MRITFQRIALVGIMCVLALLPFIWSIGLQPSVGAASLEVTTLAGYHLSVFATGNGSYSHPDSVVADSAHVYVGYQNVTAKDGTDHKTSTIVEYTLSGKVVQTFKIPGHCDGLRINPATHLLWATSNEDANPALVTIDPANGHITPYQFSSFPHGGGFDDMAFVNGLAFISASNPTLNKAGVNVFPAVDKIELRGTQAVLTPVLMGNATALDTTTKTMVTLNLVDPDSMTVDTQGNIVLVNQAGAELIFLHHAGTSQQTVTHVPAGTQVDDTVWVTAPSGRFLIADGKTNTIYTFRGPFTSGSVYAEAPSDAGVASFIGTLDLKKGLLTPVAIGFGSPTGLLYLPT